MLALSPLSQARSDGQDPGIWGGARARSGRSGRWPSSCCLFGENHKEFLGHIIELDDGKIYRKALYLMVKNHGFPVDFPLNQSNDHNIGEFMKFMKFDGPGCDSFDELGE